MRKPWIIFAVLLLAAACDSDDGDASNGSAAAGGEAGIGGDGGGGDGSGEAGTDGSAGSADNGDDVPDCVGLFEEMFVALQEGATCDLDDADACTGMVTVDDNCGCAQVMSDMADNVQDVQAKVAAFVDACGSDGCAGVICPSTEAAMCFDVGDGAGPRCRWAD